MKILMLTESNFPHDTRVKQEAYKLNEHGHDVSVIAIKDREQNYYEINRNIRVYRVPKVQLFKYGKQYKTMNLPFLDRLSTLLMAIAGFGFEWLYFTAACFLLSLLLFLKDNFDVIHTHNPPDTLFTVALFYKLLGKKFVYDHHDLSPDLFSEKYGSRYKSVYQLLLLLEKLSCRTANLIIATNESYKAIEVIRCRVKPEDIYVVRNGPDLNEMKITNPIEQIKAERKVVLCYLGIINIQDGVDYLLEAFSRIVHKYKKRDVLLLIIGEGEYLHKIKELAATMDINQFLHFTGYILDRNELNRYLSTADIFIDTAPYSFLNDNSTFVKLMEYLIYGKPIVSFALKESMHSLKDAGIFVPPNDTDQLARTIIDLMNDQERKNQLGSNAIKRGKELSWNKVSKPLIEAYERLSRI